MEGFESFNPSPENKRAREEERERRELITHSEEELFDEIASPPTAGADEEKRVKSMKKKDVSGDLMGSVPDALPDDPSQLAAWVEKEKQRLEKKKGFKKAA